MTGASAGLAVLDWGRGPFQPEEIAMSSSSTRRPRARRRLRLEAGMTLLEILIVLAILALVMGFLIGPRVFAAFQESKGEVARSIAKKLAYEAYPQWSMKPANQGKCPTTSDLAEYVNQKAEFNDPWGSPYIIKCGADLPAGARGIAVYSKGEDGKDNTGDDQRSWEQQ